MSWKSWVARPFQNVMDDYIDIKDADLDGQPGKGMFAKRTLRPRDIICDLKQPLLLALDTARLVDTCYNCHMQPQEVMASQVGSSYGRPEPNNDESQLRLCSGCKVVRYCSRRCQKTSWQSAHRFECDIYKAAYPRIMPNSMRAVFRLIKMKDLHLVSQSQWDAFLKCPSHVQELSTRVDEEFFKIVQMVNSTIELSKTKLDHKIVLELYCRLKINAITLMTPTFDPIGLCLHPTAARINHSCNPNAYIRFGSPQETLTYIELTPLRTIEVDEEITISYVDENKPGRMRQAELLHRYCFECRCARCIQEKEDGDQKYEFSTEQQAIVAKVEGYIEAAESNTSKYMPVQNLSYALHLLSVNNWHKRSYPYPQALQKLVVAFIDQRQFNLAMAYAAIQTFDVDPLVYAEEFHPIRLIHLHVLVRLITVVLDGRHADPFDQELHLQPFNVLSDLKYWHGELARKLREQATRTYGIGEMLLRLTQDADHLYDFSTAQLGEHTESAGKAQREKRWRKLMNAMYERTNDKSRWHS